MNFTSARRGPKLARNNILSLPEFLLISATQVTTCPRLHHRLLQLVLLEPQHQNLVSYVILSPIYLTIHTCKYIFPCLVSLRSPRSQILPYSVCDLYHLVFQCSNPLIYVHKQLLNIPGLKNSCIYLEFDSCYPNVMCDAIRECKIKHVVHIHHGFLILCMFSFNLVHSS